MLPSAMSNAIKQSSRTKHIAIFRNIIVSEQAWDDQNEARNQTRVRE